MEGSIGNGPGRKISLIDKIGGARRWCDLLALDVYGIVDLHIDFGPHSRLEHQRICVCAFPRW
jgi:hypothetical protein